VLATSAVFDLAVGLVQRAGRATISGFGFSDAFMCLGETPWSGTVSGFNGRFAAGPAEASVSLAAFDPVTGDRAEPRAFRTVRLRGSR
jgi:hypothetical protein